MATKVRRDFAGHYTVTCKIDEGDYYDVAVSFRSDLRGWIAAAQWDRLTYTDPLPTKRAAVREARRMIDCAVTAEIARLLASNAARFAALRAEAA